MKSKQKTLEGKSIPIIKAKSYSKNSKSANSSVLEPSDKFFSSSIRIMRRSNTLSNANPWPPSILS